MGEENMIYMQMEKVKHFETILIIALLPVEGGFPLEIIFLIT